MRRNQLFFFFVFLVVYWIFIIVNGNKPLIDQYTEAYLRRIVSFAPIFNGARLLTNLGSKQFLIPFVSLGMIIFYVRFRSAIPSVIFGAGTLLTYYLHLLVKGIVQRARPQIWEAASATGYSFPSGHSMISLVCYGLFIYFVIKLISNKVWRKGLITCFSILILFIGLSRFVINVHYMSDIVSGFIFGYFLLLTFIFIDKKLNKRIY